MVIAGALLLGLALRGRALVLLLVVPAYYLCAQSALSTEYRYILAIHYFLFALAAVTLFCAGLTVKQMTQRVTRRLKNQRAGVSGLSVKPE
jgi:hypothetical protein